MKEGKREREKEFNSKKKEENTKIPFQNGMRGTKKNNN